MAGRSRVDRERLDQFNRYWDKVYQKVPEARAQAVKAMGEAVFQELGQQIQVSDLQSEAKGNVRDWQEMRLGSRGGYFAVSPRKKDKPGDQAWKGNSVTMKQVTRWLERGHGARKPAPGSLRRWSRYTRSGLNIRTGTRFIKGRQFYSRTRLKATDIALKAADRVLSKLYDDVEWE